MTRLSLAAIAAPLLIAACAPKPTVPPAPVMSASELACATAAADLTGLDATTVVVVPVTATKTGATVYDVSAGGVDYVCVVEFDQTVSQFSAK